MAVPEAENDVDIVPVDGMTTRPVALELKVDAVDPEPETMIRPAALELKFPDAEPVP